MRARTAVTRPPLCPEVELHLATDVTSLWEATEEALRREGLPPPFWAFCWPGGQALARWLMDTPLAVDGLRVLDFGAGCGIAAIAAAKAGARSVTASELDAFAGAAMRANFALNAVEVEVLLEDLMGRGPDWDVVLIGDLCYERPLAESLVAWLKELVRGGVRVILADPGRAYLPSSGLRRIASYDVPTSLELEDAEHRLAVLYELE